MYLEIEKKAKIYSIEQRQEVLNKLKKDFGQPQFVVREDFYLINSMGQEVRISLIDAGNKRCVEQTYKYRKSKNNLEINDEYIICSSNSVKEVLDFWRVLDFCQNMHKIKKYFHFESDILKISVVEISWKNQKTIHVLPDFYLEVECVELDFENANIILNNFFNKMGLQDFEDMKYTDLIKQQEN